MKVVVPMAGFGKRFVQAGYQTPKSFIQVDGKPIIQHIIELFPGVPSSDFIFICNNEHVQNTDAVQVLRRLSPDAQIVSILPHNHGPVYTLLKAQEFIPDDDEVIVSYCDYGTVWDFDKFLFMRAQLSPDGAVASYIGFHPHMLGKDHYAYMKHEGLWMTAIQEKQPFGDNKMEEYASNGTYYVKSGRMLKHYCQSLMDSGCTVNGEYYVSMIFNLMVNDGLRVRIFEIEKMLQWGTPYDLQVYQMWSGYFHARQTHRLEPRLPDTLARETLTILPMAGRGSRFALKGFTTPKPFVDVEGSAMVVRALEALPPTHDLLLVTLKEHMDSHHHHFAGISKTIHTLEDVTDGQATTCMVAMEATGVDLQRPLIISACDNGAYYDVQRHTQLVEDVQNDVVVWAFDNHPTSKLYPQMYAWLDVDEDMYVRRVSIKKPFDDCENTYAIIGTMFFRSGKIFKEGYDYIKQHDIRTNGEYYVDNVLQPLIDKGYKVKMFVVDYYLCWGTPEDYKTYNYWKEHFARG